MKRITYLFLTTISLLIASCMSTAKFPVSNVIPAAEITAKMKQDKNQNYIVEVYTQHMASADRLNPPKKNYIVWILTEQNEIKNIGQLRNKNSESSYLKTTIPFKVREIFITAEEQGDVSKPSGVEISRTKFNKQ